MSNMTAAELAKHLGGHQSGSNWSAPCPAHSDSTPSLSIAEGDGGRILVKCFAGCEQDAVISALRELGLWTTENPGLTVTELAAAKSLPVEALSEAGLKDGTYKDKPCVVIPYLNRQRREVAVQYRIALKGKDRFRFRKGDSAKQLFGLDRWRPSELTLLVEGSTDVLTARLHKHNCLGVSGADGWDDSFSHLFDDCELIYLVKEPDKGGQQLTAALAESPVRDKVRVVLLPDGMKDLNELHCNDAVRFDERLQAALMAAEPIESRAVMITASAVITRPLEWLVHNILAVAKVNLLAGDPGLGKSLVTLDLTAAVTTEGRYPWMNAATGEVVLLSAEDDPEDTIVPRLKAAGANLDRVHVLTAVRHYDPKTGEAGEHHFSLADDLSALDDALRQRGGRVRLLIIDPISAYLGNVDSHVNAQVRAALAPLAALAARHRVAVVIVSHLNKGGGVGGGNALYRVSGSLAFTAAARAAFAVAQDEADAERRLFLPLKHNLAKMGDGYAYRVNERDGVPILQWEAGRVAVTAAEALTSAKERRDAEVEAWMLDRLGSGYKFAKSMWAEAESMGFSEKRVKAAKKRLGVETDKQPREDGNKGWTWSLPGPPPRSPARPPDPLNPLNPLGPLEGGQGGQGGQEGHKENERTSSLTRIDEINRELENAGYGL